MGVVSVDFWLENVVCPRFCLGVAQGKGLHQTTWVRFLELPVDVLSLVVRKKYTVPGFSYFFLDLE
jgi:hypothetical protein